MTFSIHETSPPRARPRCGTGLGLPCTNLGHDRQSGRRWSSIMIGWLFIDSGRTKSATTPFMNPSSHFLPSPLPFSYMPHCTQASDGWLCDERRPPPLSWVPSLVCTPTDGWTCCRRATPRWGPTCAHPHESRSGGVLRPSMTQRA
jgi:hypothetical protein